MVFLGVAGMRKGDAFWSVPVGSLTTGPLERGSKRNRTSVLGEGLCARSDPHSTARPKNRVMDMRRFMVEVFDATNLLAIAPNLVADLALGFTRPVTGRMVHIGPGVTISEATIVSLFAVSLPSITNAFSRFSNTCTLSLFAHSKGIVLAIIHVG